MKYKLTSVIIMFLIPFFLFSQKCRECEKALEKAKDERNNVQSLLNMSKNTQQQLERDVARLERKISTYEEQLKIHKGEAINTVENPDSQELAAYNELKREYDSNLLALDKLVKKNDQLEEQNLILNGEKQEWNNKFDSLFLQQKQILTMFQKIQKQSESSFGDTIVIDWQKEFDDLLMTFADLNDKYTEKPKVPVKKDTIVKTVTISPKVLKLEQEIEELEEQLASNKAIYDEANLLVENFFRAEAKFYVLDKNRYTVNTSRIGTNQKGLKYQITSLDNCSNKDIVDISKCFAGGLKRYAGVTKTSLSKVQSDMVVILKCNRQTANLVQMELTDIPIQYVPQHTSSSEASIFIELKSEDFFNNDFDLYDEKKSRLERNIRVKEQRIQKIETQ